MEKGTVFPASEMMDEMFKATRHTTYSLIYCSIENIH